MPGTAYLHQFREWWLWNVEVVTNNTPSVYYYYKPFRKLTSASEDAFMRIYDPDVVAGADTVDFSAKF